MRLPGDLRRLVYDFVDGPATPWTLCHLAIIDYDCFLYQPVYRMFLRDHTEWWNYRFSVNRRMGVYLPDNVGLIARKNKVIYQLRRKHRKAYLDGICSYTPLALALTP